MNGAARIGYALLGAALRLVAWAPLGFGHFVMLGVEWCDQKAAAAPAKTERD